MVRGEDAVHIYQSLSANGITTWLTGGWGIDALLGTETRPHKDLDILILVDDVTSMRQLLARAGYTLKELWSENAWALDSRGAEVPTALVLRDLDGREVDAHALRFDSSGNGIPAWANDEGWVFTRADLSGEGTIGDTAVRCLSPAMQLRCHSGYSLPESQVHDLSRLREKFRIQPGVQRQST